MFGFQTWVEFGGTHHHLWPNMWSMKSWKMQLLTSSNLTLINHRQALQIIKKRSLDNNITLPAKSIQTFSPLLSKIYSNKKPLTLKVFYCCSVACLCCCLSFFHFFFVGFCFYCGQNFTSLMGQILLHEFENLLQMLVHSGLVEI